MTRLLADVCFPARVTALAEMRSDFFAPAHHTSLVERVWRGALFGQHKIRVIFAAKTIFAIFATFAVFVAAPAANIPSNRQILSPIRMVT
jgi:hypothetical protein